MSTSDPQSTVDVVYREPLTTTVTPTTTTTSVSSTSGGSTSGSVADNQELLTEAPTATTSTEMNVEAPNEEKEEVTELDIATPFSPLEDVPDSDLPDKNDVL
jgi:hypothetical protein